MKTGLFFCISSPCFRVHRRFPLSVQSPTRKHTQTRTPTRTDTHHNTHAHTKIHTNEHKQAQPESIAWHTQISFPTGPKRTPWSPKMGPRRGHPRHHPPEQGLPVNDGHARLAGATPTTPKRTRQRAPCADRQDRVSPFVAFCNDTICSLEIPLFSVFLLYFRKENGIGHPRLCCFSTIVGGIFSLRQSDTGRSSDRRRPSEATSMHRYRSGRQSPPPLPRWS